MRIALIALGGALGTLLRYGAWSLMKRVTSAPLGTLAVNIVGCFVLALVAEAALRGAKLSEDARLALSVGFCGGLTTYSSFNQEAFAMLRAGEALAAVGYFVATVALCALAAVAGLLAARPLT